MRRLLLPAFLLLLLACAPAALAAQPGVTPLGNFYDGKHQVDEFGVITGALSKAPAGGKWVRLFVDWNQLERRQGTLDDHELGLLQARVARFQGAGMKIALVVSSAPAWAAAPQGADGARQYADFMGRLARSVPGVDVWEPWNEPNITGFSPEQYTALLQATYPAVKASSPGSAVIVGGLAGSDYAYVEGIYAAGGQSAFDGIGLHTDTACLTNGPSDVAYRDAATGRVGFTVFTGYREVRQLMLDHGDAAKGIYLTEIGWAIAKDKKGTLKCDQGANKNKKAGGVTEAQQTTFLKQAYACLAADPYVVMASWFTDQDHTDPRRKVAGYGLYDWAGKKRPIFGAMQTVGDGSGAGVNRSCGGKVDRDAPQVSINAGPTWFGRLIVSGAASDAGTGVTKVELWGDGKKIISQRADVLRKQGGKFRYDWFGSSKLGYGKHVVELRAYDEAGNVGKAAVEVERLNPATAPRSFTPDVTYALKRSGRKLTVSARIRSTADKSFREKPRGRMELRFERFKKGKWKRSKIRTGISSGRVRKSYTAYDGGRWRAYAVLDVEAPYKRIRTKPVTFKLR